MENKFKIQFFKYYDQKIADGTITFSTMGMTKSDFIRLCTEEGFVPDEEVLERVFKAMKLNEDEKKEIYGAIRECR